MYTSHHRLSPATTHFFALFFALTIFLIGMGTGIPGTARAADNIGIYWDTDFTQDATLVSTYPTILTGHLVLKDPSVPFGIVGWELCADMVGPANILGWALEGQAVNVSAPPCFSVGIGPAPIRSDRDVLLATFQIMVTDSGPVTMSVRPHDQASVPGQMSFIPYGDLGNLLPMTTLSGQPEVAWINDQNPHFTVNPAALDFTDSPLGIEVVKSVTVSNFGAVPGNLDIALAASGCDMFSLPGISGPVTIPPGDSISITVACLAQTTDPFSCNLALGGGAADVPLVGNGWEAVISWDAPTELDLGTVALGFSNTLPISIVNTGDEPILIDASLPPDCAEFMITGGGGPYTILPGFGRTIGIKFSPGDLGAFSCFLDLGSIVPDVHLTGIGREPVADWTIAPAALDFGAVAVGGALELGVVISNTGETTIPVAPAMPGTCPEFTVVDGGAPISLAPGEAHSTTVSFVPTAVGVNYTCSLDLGTVLPDVPLSGWGREAIFDWVAPTFHDFGGVGVGLYKSYTATITNTGEVGFLVNPSLPDTAQSFILNSGSSYFLPVGQSMSLSVQFHPLVPGSHSVALDLGTVVPPVQLQGEGLPRPVSWTVNPNPLAFGTMYVGTSRQETVVISNVGGTYLDLDIGLVNAGPEFSLISGAGLFYLEPGGVHAVVVQFQPGVEGTFVTTLNLGPEVGSIQVSGTAITTAGVCVIQPDSLDFGTVLVGSSQFRTFSVTNDGIEPMNVSPVSSSSVFLVGGVARRLDPGQTAYYSATFQPQLPGDYTGSIDLGSDLCGDVAMTGIGTTNAGPGQNMVGIFFDDPGFSVIEAQTFGPNEVVEGYLVLVEPSETSGVGAWELAVDIDGDAQWLGWALEGQHINVGTYNEFIVGIGGSPLPYAPAIKLATFQILIALPYPSIVYLELSPIRQPSLPDQMVWAPWHDASLLLPMYPFTGERVVAGINWGSPVGVGNPPPHAVLTGGEVALEWPVPENPGDGCHVYRRDDAGASTRLTSLPVTGFGTSLQFTDRPSGYAAGSVLYYSYSVVTDGVEGPRSPETEIKLAGIPVVATRLLPNIPNPFNPQTDIRFELSRPQQARVAVYDVTGRLVKTLADGYLVAGPHTRVWQGRDNGGRRVPSGAYYLRLTTDGRVDHRKMMLLK
ncbi:MAG: choice-of-anchor D domain-containing protein [Candidatus Krumholzibacteriota bacterium]